MRIRRRLMDMVLEIARLDRLADYDIASMCGTSRPRGSNLLHRHIKLFNSETLIDILARMGVTIDIVVVRRVPYLRWKPSKGRPGWRPPPGWVTGD